VRNRTPKGDESELQKRDQYFEWRSCAHMFRRKSASAPLSLGSAAAWSGKRKHESARNDDSK
jgi:hypothetical protein